MQLITKAGREVQSDYVLWPQPIQPELTPWEKMTVEERKDYALKLAKNKNIGPATRKFTFTHDGRKVR